MKKLNLSLAIIFFLLPFFSIAQSNYKPGYVVTTKGDTVRGFIDYRAWDSNPSTINFKSKVTDANRKQFTISDMSFFTVEGLASYRKYTVSVSKDITNLTNLSNIRDTSFEIETVLLKELQKGQNLALFSFTDQLKTRFYLGEKPDFAPKELVYRVYENKSEREGTKYENDYLKYLFALANKYNVMDDDLARTFEKGSYTSDCMLEIVSKINHISKQDFEKKYKRKTELKLFAGAGLNISNTSSSSASSYTAGGGPGSTSFLPEFSVGLNLMPDPDNFKLEFRLEVMYAMAKFNAIYPLKVSPFNEERAAYDQSEISLIPQIIYDFYSTPGLKIFAGVGIAFGQFSHSSVYFGPNDPNGSDNGIGKNDPFIFYTSDDSFIAKAGVKIHKNWEIYVNYITSQSITNGGYFQLSNTSTQVGVLYFFGK